MSKFLTGVIEVKESTYIFKYVAGLPRKEFKILTFPKGLDILKYVDLGVRVLPEDNFDISDTSIDILEIEPTTDPLHLLQEVEANLDRQVEKLVNASLIAEVSSNISDTDKLRYKHLVVEVKAALEKLSKEMFDLTLFKLGYQVAYNFSTKSVTVDKIFENRQEAVYYAGYLKDKYSSVLTDYEIRTVRYIAYEEKGDTNIRV